MPNAMQNAEWLWSLVIRVRNLSKSGFIYGHCTGKTDLKLDSLSLLTLIPKLQSHLQFCIRHFAKYPCWTAREVLICLENRETLVFTLNFRVIRCYAVHQMPNAMQNAEWLWSLVIRVTKLSESGVIRLLLQKLGTGQCTIYDALPLAHFWAHRC